MTQLVRFRIDDSDSVVFEMDEAGQGGVVDVGADDGIFESAQTFTEKLDSVRSAIATTLEKLRDDLSPETMTIRFGVKVSTEAGVVVAKSAGEAHLEVEMQWGNSTLPE